MLFGHQHNDVSQPAPEPVSTPAEPSLNPLAVDPTTGVSLPVAPESPMQSSEDSSVLQQPATGTVLDPGPATPPPPPPPPTSAPMVTETPEAAMPAAPVVEPTIEVPEPAVEVPTELPQPTLEEPVMPFDVPEPPAEQLPQTMPAAPMAPSEHANPDDLISLKQQALAELEPLVDQLDQTPEERYRTKIMLLQSTDDQTLIKDAYAAAQQITDEKARAQALLDIVNEINYFTSLTK
jgi:hypothetical protein